MSSGGFFNEDPDLIIEVCNDLLKVKNDSEFRIFLEMVKDIALSVKFRRYRTVRVGDR